MKKKIYTLGEYQQLIQKRGGATWLAKNADISIQQAYNILRGASSPSEATLSKLGAIWVIEEIR